MSNNIRKPKIVTSILVIVVVFLMSAGAFIGAAENGSTNDASESIAPIFPENPVAGKTEGIIDVPVIEDYEPIVPSQETSAFDDFEPETMDLEPISD